MKWRRLQVQTATVLYVLCSWSVASLNASGRADIDEHQEPSSLFQPPSTALILKRGRPFPLRCVMEDGELHAVLLEESPALKSLEFEWIVPWNETIEPRYRQEANAYGFIRRHKVSLRGPELPDTVKLPGTPLKTRVLVRVRAEGGIVFWDETVKSCWTGRRVHRPGAVAKFSVLSLNKVTAFIYIPLAPNGPLDGLMLRWCPRSDLNCAPEDVLFSNQVTNVEYAFATLLEPAEDHETEKHELCVAFYNLRHGERLLGPLSCTAVKNGQ